MITADDARRLLSYDPETGRLTWRSRDGADRITLSWNAKNAGKVAGSNNHGYIKVSLLGRDYPAHRVAWLIAYGEWPAEIDHINRDRADNRLANLRSVTRSQNSMNKVAQSNNASGLKGVSPHGSGWRAELCGKKLGTYRTKEAAWAAYCSAGREIYGEFFNPGE